MRAAEVLVDNTVPPKSPAEHHEDKIQKTTTVVISKHTLEDTKDMNQLTSGSQSQQPQLPPPASPSAQPQQQQQHQPQQQTSSVVQPQVC